MMTGRRTDAVAEQVDLDGIAGFSTRAGDMTKPSARPNAVRSRNPCHRIRSERAVRVGISTNSPGGTRFDRAELTPWAVARVTVSAGSSRRPAGADYWRDELAEREHGGRQTGRMTTGTVRRFSTRTAAGHSSLPGFSACRERGCRADRDHSQRDTKCRRPWTCRPSRTRRR
jgi:hypothetical protein